jgi:hypothetical protein
VLGLRSPSRRALGQSACVCGELLIFDANQQFATHTVLIPAGCSIFPKEIFREPRRWMEQRYTKLVYFNELDKGGHFAAFEQAEIFVHEVCACFRQIRQAAR